MKTPAQTLPCICHALSCAALCAVLLTSSIMDFTIGSSPGARELMPSVVRPWPGSVLTTRHMGVPDKGSSWSSFRLMLYEYARLAANRCCLESRLTGMGVSPDFLIIAPHGVIRSAPKTDLACGLRRRRRSYRLCFSLESHQSSLPCSETVWTQVTWTALTLYGTTPYVFLRVQSLASAALALFTHRLWCSLNLR
jgi:hypothetical protein